jgi:uncharacterized protein YcaQ
MKESLSIQQAQKLVLHSQRVLTTNQSGRAIEATLSAIEHLGYIQIDTISVIQRAHHHTLWNRNPRYQESQLDLLLESKQVFEYWSHAAAYLPFRDYRFSLPRKHALKSGKQSHWHDRDDKMIQWVLKRITAEGPLLARDFEQAVQNIGGWKAKPAKRALEYLFMQGDLMVPRRDNFHKVYDLTERVLPEGTDTRPPSPEEYARFLITRYLRSNGLGQAAEIAYLLNGTKVHISSTLKDMEAAGRILSPFDNLVIQRKRLKALFDFDYQIECYVPEHKRQYGYFSLPILWDGKLVARMDCKAERKASMLHIHHLALEATVLKNDAFLAALCKELECFLKFNHCNKLRLHRTSPANIKPELQTLINDWTGD